MQVAAKSGRLNGVYFLSLRDVFTCGGRSWHKPDARSAFEAARKLCPMLFGNEENEELLKPLWKLGVVDFDAKKGNDEYVRSDIAIFIVFRGPLNARSLGLYLVQRFFLSRWADDLDESAADAAHQQVDSLRHMSTRLSIDAAALPDVDFVAAPRLRKLSRYDNSDSDSEDDEQGDFGPFESCGHGLLIRKLDCDSISQVQARGALAGASVSSTRATTGRLEWVFSFPNVAQASSSVIIRKDGCHCFWIRFTTHDKNLVDGFFSVGFSLNEQDLPQSIRKSPLSAFLLQRGNERFLRSSKSVPDLSPPISRSVWDDSQIAKLVSLIKCECGNSFQLVVEHQQLCSILLLSPTCDDAVCLKRKVYSSDRLVIATEAGKRFGRMGANADFALVAEMTTPATGRLGDLLQQFGLSATVPRLSVKMNTALENCVEDEWATESKHQCEVLGLSSKPSLSLDGVWKNQQRRAKRSTHCSVSSFNGDTNCLVALESVSVATVAAASAPVTSTLFTLGGNLENVEIEEMDHSNDSDEEEQVAVNEEIEAPSTDATICLEKMAAQRLTLGLFSHLFVRGVHPVMICVDGPTGLKNAISSSIDKVSASREWVERPRSPGFVHDPFHLLRVALKQFDKLAGARIGARQPKLFPQLTLGAKAFFKNWVRQKLLTEAYPMREDVLGMLLSFPLDLVFPAVSSTLQTAFEKMCRAIASKALGSSPTMHTSVCESFNASFLGKHTSKREVYTACNYSARMKMAGLDWNRCPNWHNNVLKAVYKKMNWK